MNQQNQTLHPNVVFRRATFGNGDQALIADVPGVMDISVHLDVADYAGSQPITKQEFKQAAATKKSR